MAINSKVTMIKLLMHSTNAHGMPTTALESISLYSWNMTNYYTLLDIIE